MGLFALFLTILQIFTVLGRLGFDTSFVRFVAEYSSHSRWDLIKEIYIKALRLLIPFNIFLSGALYFFAPWIAKNIFKKEYLTEYFQLAAFGIFPMVLLLINSGSFRGLKKIKKFLFFSNISTFLFAVFLLAIFLWFKKENHFPLFSYNLSLVIGAILSTIVWLKNSKMRSLVSQNTIKIKKILKISLSMLLSSSLYIIMLWADTIMLGIFRSEEEVGVYNVAVKIATIMSITLFAINSIAAPKFSELFFKSDMKGLEKIVHLSTKLIFWSSFPILLVIFLFPSFILGIFGEKFTLGVYALLILTAGQFVNAISGSVGYFLQMTGKQNVFQNILLGATVLNITLNYILIPKYGINGAALASMISMCFWNISSGLYIRAHFKILTFYIPFKKS